jgi:ribosomal RNA assembly protein
MTNIHPIYNIKELMIRRELSKNPEMKEVSWDKFLPHFKKQNSKRKKVKRAPAKPKSPFPPEQKLRKIDEQMISGEYFLTQEEKDNIKGKEKLRKREAKRLQKKEKRAKVFEAPVEPDSSTKKKEEEVSSKPDLNDLKKKFLKKRTRD